MYNHTSATCASESLAVRFKRVISEDQSDTNDYDCYGDDDDDDGDDVPCASALQLTPLISVCVQ